MPSPTLILASSSPRRRELLSLGGWTFDVRPADVDETPFPAEPAADYVQRLSRAKAQAMAAPPEAVVIGADTIVVLDGRILGKPAQAAEAREFLRALRGRPHLVLTGLSVYAPRREFFTTDLVASSVPMRDYPDADIEHYIASGDPFDKAGAYAIQHSSFQPVDLTLFHDCFANVMGLPLCHVLRRLRQLALPALTDAPMACQNFIPYACPIFQNILSAPLD
jgi:MAF protein